MIATTHRTTVRTRRGACAAGRARDEHGTGQAAPRSRTTGPFVWGRVVWVLVDVLVLPTDRGLNSRVPPKRAGALGAESEGPKRGTLTRSRRLG